MVGKRGLAATAGLASQVFSSLTNFAAVVTAARLLSAEDFGWFSVAYALYLLVLGGFQATVSQVLVLQGGDLMGVCRLAVTRTWWFGAGLATILAIAVAVLPEIDPGRSTLLVMAASLPVLLVQDVLRTVSATLGRPAVAVLSDATWLLCLVCGLSVAMHLGNDSPAFLLGIWAGAGALATVVAGAILARPLANAQPEGLPLASLGSRFLAEYVMTQGVNQASVVALGAVAGVSATGAFRGTVTLFGPIGVPIGVIPVMLVPTLRRLSPQALQSAQVGLCAVLSILPVLAIIILIAAPTPLGQALLGDTWSEAKHLVIPIGLQFAAIGVSTVGFTSLRIVEPRRTLPIKIAGSGMFLVAFWAGYVVGGVPLAAWGLFVGSAGQGLLGWIAYRRAVLRSRQPQMSAVG